VFKEDLIREVGELSPNIGEILVSLCYNGNIARLTVTVLEAKGIKVFLNDLLFSSGVREKFIHHCMF